MKPKAKSKADRKPPKSDILVADEDYGRRCMVCGQTPTIHPTGLCGACCCGEADY